MKKRKLSKRKILIFLFLLLFIILMIYSMYKILFYIKSNKENREIKDSINKSIIIDDMNNYKIDFDKLKYQNPDTVAYLEVKGTNINYVVVRGEDNSYYLSHNFNKDYNVSGWVFSDSNNKFDGTDKNIVIFGHNMLNGSMFGTLKNVLNEEWQLNTSNHKIVLITPVEQSIYEVFSTYISDPDEYYIKTSFKNNEEFAEFISDMTERSNYNYNVNVDKNDTILTLSTCNITGQKRVVLQAKKLLN